MALLNPQTLKPMRVGYTWGRTFFNSLNLLLTIIILGLLVYLFVHINNIVKNIVDISIKSVQENKNLQPLLIDLGTTTALGVLQNTQVREKLTDVVKTATNPIQESINDKFAAHASVPAESPPKL